MEKNYFNCKVKVFISEFSTPYGWTPWLFTVEDPNGKIYQFGGSPNYCKSAKSALKRGWWRAKWLTNGTWNQHYSSDDPYAVLLNNAANAIKIGNENNGIY